ncbi:ComEA family DNA-binding protein [Herbiconiux sp. CPCC 205716]|uniref:ComEA family DNA-binding protein n=1 Tax=Herbiconiux gentiana TaxID=2970912 RepID=A0ABT2GHV7_9MICO|nr:ComEA family DNA-binding protein [Herbiconiux gentiana]MCS5714376.1 ComEA family DNA-binding protein [Herbiconiux gentiana]
MRVRVGVGAAVVLVVAALVASVLITALTPVGATTVVPDARPSASASAPPPPKPAASSSSSGSSPASSLVEPAVDAPQPLLIHVLGAVATPGVYELSAGSRVVDAVAAAGGLDPTADSASVNLARPLSDGEQLRVLAVGETPPPPLPGAPVSGGSPAGPSGAPAGAGGAGASGGMPALVNLNTATEIDLDTLPRIGPSMAARIIAYRDANGPFTSIDDLLQVPGIGDKTLESLRPLLTL